MSVTPDFINGAIELVGAYFGFLNVLSIREHKRLQGFDWRSTAFFTAWGIWNLFFYPSLGQILSTIGASAIVIVNAIWLFHVWKYRNQQDN